MVLCIFWMPCLFIWFYANIWNVFWQWLKYFLSTWSDFYNRSYVFCWFCNAGRQNHAVARGWIQNFHSYRCNSCEEGVWPREMIVRCYVCLNVFCALWVSQVLSSNVVKSLQVNKTCIGIIPMWCCEYPGPRATSADTMRKSARQRTSPPISGRHQPRWSSCMCLFCFRRVSAGCYGPSVWKISSLKVMFG